MAKQRLDLTDERLSPFKVILWLAWPLFLEQILATLVSFVDNAMVGSLGAYASASISISNSFVFLINGAVMALGVGLASLRDDATSQEDSFGMVALSSIGPILAVLILGICYNPSTANYHPTVVPEVFNSQDVFKAFASTALLPKILSYFSATFSK